MIKLDLFITESEAFVNTGGEAMFCYSALRRPAEEIHIPVGWLYLETVEIEVSHCMNEAREIALGKLQVEIEERLTRQGQLTAITHEPETESA